MHLKIRLQHKKLEAIMSMIERTDRLIMTYTKQLEKYPNEIFWRNEHAKAINRYKRIRYRLYAYYAGTFTKMAQTVIEKPAAVPTGNYIRPSLEILESEKSIHLPIFS